MEKDNQVKGEGNSYDFGTRIYDSRLGRFLTLDPLSKKYASYSPYLYAGNSPITFYDNGNEIVINYVENGTTKQVKYTPGVKPTVDNKFVQQVHDAISYSLNTATGKEAWGGLSIDKGVLEISEKQCPAGSGPTDNFKGGGVGSGKIGTIEWDPDSKIQVFSTPPPGEPVEVMGEMSPSTALVHEAGHAFRWMKALNSKNPIAETNEYIADEREGDGQYDNALERKNITDVENKYVREINAWEQANNPNDPQYQPVRTNHKAYVPVVRDMATGKAAKGNGPIDPSLYKEYREGAKAAGRAPDDGIKDAPKPNDR